MKIKQKAREMYFRKQRLRKKRRIESSRENSCIRKSAKRNANKSSQVLVLAATTVNSIKTSDRKQT